MSSPPGEPLTRRYAHRARTRGRLVVAARTTLSFTGEITPPLIADICAQAGVNPSGFRSIFASNDDLLDAVNALLVEECAARLHAGVSAFEAPGDGTDMVAAAFALASSWPIDRGGLLIRSRRRVSALLDSRNGSNALEADRRFSDALTEILSELVAKLGRQFSWNPAIAVRVILDAYERSFEAWILSSHSEQSFAESPFVARTLPALIEGVTASSA